jgi:O-antigen/teichoic acid export membrane protein
LSRDSIIYGLSVVISQFVGFLLIPLYTRYLDPDEYGVVEILNTTIVVLGIIIGLGLTTALLRSYCSREDEEGKRRVASTVVVFLTVTSLVVLAVLELAAGHISPLIFRSEEVFTHAEYTKYFRIVFLTLFLNEGVAIALTVFRARGEPSKYATASIAQFLLAVTLNLVFVVGLRRGVEGVLYADMVTTACIYAVLMAGLVRQVGIRLSRHELRAMLAYGLPLVPTGLGSWMLVMADRWILVMLRGTGPVGVYSLGYKFGMVIQGMLVGPIQLAWLPFLFATAKQPKARETYIRVFTYFVLIALFAALAISTLAKELLMVMADPKYQDAYKVIPLVALSYVLYGCYFQLAAGIYLEGKTKFMALLMGIAAVVNVALNFALIPHYGIMGSAAATLVGYALLPVGTYVISQRYYRIDYEWTRVIKLAVVAALIYVASIFVGRSYSLVHSHVIVGGGKVLLLLTYPVLLYAIKFFRPEEIGLFKQSVRSATAYVARKLGKKPSSPDGPGSDAE